MSVKRPVALRMLLATAAVTVAATGVPTANADSILVATRSGASGADVATSAGIWRFTVTDISGKPAQVFLRFETADGSVISFAGAHPRVGQTFESYQEGGVGPHKLRAKLHGGPVGPNDSVTLQVDAP